MLEQSRLIVVALNQDCAAIYHNGLPSTESFLHQKQIGLRDLMSFADSASWQTLAHALIQVLAFCPTHALPPSHPPSHPNNQPPPPTAEHSLFSPSWCQLDR